jgi:hypothetical protein
VTVEIALGIVLAVIILAFLPYIIGLGIIAIGIALVLAVAAAIIYFASVHPGLSLLLFVIALFIWLSVVLYEKYPGFKRFIESFNKKASPVFDIIGSMALWVLIAMMLYFLSITLLPIVGILLTPFSIVENDDSNTINILVSLIVVTLSTIIVWGIFFLYKKKAASIRKQNKSKIDTLSTGG